MRRLLHRSSRHPARPLRWSSGWPGALPRSGPGWRSAADHGRRRRGSGTRWRPRDRPVSMRSPAGRPSPRTCHSCRSRGGPRGGRTAG
ncbi:hypothetical protein ACFFX0_05285 [Citricoccus parietis]|uniref:Uncharacterized protein n=1 Tax=Citricoccus parietis TaxID=592307 RepID=A0ABV5FVE1_9MICC